MEKSYTNGEVTVYWEPKLCSHAAKCWKSLPSVFKPRERPWVNIDGAPTDDIKSAVLGCPSGALSLQPHAPMPELEAPQQAGSEVRVVGNGPLEIKGRLLIQEGGRQVELIGKTYFCRCGASANKPYCDGTHTRIGFEG